MATDDLQRIADQLLVSAGFDIHGNDTKTIATTCGYNNVCKKYFNISECDPNNNCHILRGISSGTLPKAVYNDIKPLVIKNKDTNTSSSTEEVEVYDDINLNCPRTMQSRFQIQNKCTNYRCQWNSKKMAFNCILLHSRAFFRDAPIPDRVLNIATGFSNRVYDRYNKLSIYFIRMYLILLKYVMENMKVDYSLLFHTQQIYDFFHFHSPKPDSDYVECCPRCGAYLNSKRLVSINIKHANEAHIIRDTSCTCSNKNVLDRRLKYTEKYRSLLTKERYPDKPKLGDCSYQEFYTAYKDQFLSRSLIFHVLSHVKINDTTLADVPLGFLLKAYTLMYGEFDALNFGLETVVGNKLYNTFVGSN